MFLVQMALNPETRTHSPNENHWVLSQHIARCFTVATMLSANSSVKTAPELTGDASDSFEGWWEKHARFACRTDRDDFALIADRAAKDVRNWFSDELFVSLLNRMLQSVHTYFGLAQDQQSSTPANSQQQSDRS